MISKAKLNEVMTEIQRLLKCINNYEVSQRQIQNAKDSNTPYTINTPKESGAVKRASMDLTRALANLRKSTVD